MQTIQEELIRKLRSIHSKKKRTQKETNYVRKKSEINKLLKLIKSMSKKNLRSLVLRMRGVLKKTANSTLRFTNAVLILGSICPSLQASYSVHFTGVYGTKQKKLTARHSRKTQINLGTIPFMKPVVWAMKHPMKIY